MKDTIPASDIVSAKIHTNSGRLAASKGIDEIGKEK